LSIMLYKSFILSITFLSCYYFSNSQSQTKAGLSEFGLSFVPDYTFKGSSLKGWHVLGDADWRAKDGELVGKAKNGSGGWLVLDQGLQDVGFHAIFKTTENSETAILTRMEKIDGGYRGVLLSLKKGDITPYSINLDAQGKEIKREK